MGGCEVGLLVQPVGIGVRCRVAMCAVGVVGGIWRIVPIGRTGVLLSAPACPGSAETRGDDDCDNDEEKHEAYEDDSHMRW